MLFLSGLNGYFRGVNGSTRRSVAAAVVIGEVADDTADVAAAAAAAEAVSILRLPHLLLLYPCGFLHSRPCYPI